MKFFFDDGDEQIGRYGTPDLRLNRVLACAEKTLDPQMLLHPLEEQRHLPAAFVERGNYRRRQGRVGGQKYWRANSVLPIFMRHSRASKPESIANIQHEIRIVDTHKAYETRTAIGFPVCRYQISRTVVMPIRKKAAATIFPAPPNDGAGVSIPCGPIKAAARQIADSPNNAITDFASFDLFRPTFAIGFYHET